MKLFWPAALALLALGGFFLGFSGSVDDAHITFWAAQVLGREGEILNYNFERVEQSSALLQVLLLALLQRISGLSVVTLGHFSTLIAALLALFCTGRLAQRLAVSGVVMFLLATAPFFVYWSCGGMESPLLALLLLLLLLFAEDWLARGKLLLPLLLVSLAAQMARPEMPLVLCIFGLALLPLQYLCKLSQWRWRALLFFVLIQFLCAAIITAWRWYYFDALAPQPVSAKAGGDLFSAVQFGWQYLQLTLLDWCLLLPTLLACAGVLLVLLRRCDPLWLLLALLATVYSAFVLLSGGDWMAAGRFWVPVLPLFVLLSMRTLETFRVDAVRYFLVAAIVLGNVIYLWRGTGIDFNGVPLWKRTKLVAADHTENYSFFELHAREHLHDIATLSFVQPLVEQCLAQKNDGQPLLVMAGQMGMVPFYLATQFGHRLHFQDRNGITERTLTHCPVAANLLRTRNGIGTGYEWLMDNREALARECGFAMPDLVFDIETGWNRRNIKALEDAGYVFVYRQRGHIFSETPGEWLLARKIGAGQFIAVSQAVWERLGRPAPVERKF